MYVNIALLLGQNWQMHFLGKKKKKQHYTTFLKLIKEMWTYSGVLKLELNELKL